MRNFTHRLSTLLKHAGRTFVVALGLVVFNTSASADVDIENSMQGDTIFFEDFGEECDNAYGSFEAAGLGTMSFISSLYSGYDKSSTTQFNGGNYTIINNTEVLRGMTGLKKDGKNVDNKYLVANFGDHTHYAALQKGYSQAICSEGIYGGRFLAINGSKEAGVVFRRRINELCKDTKFMFSVWLARLHGATENNNDCRFQFEMWAEDPGDAIIDSEKNNVAEANLVPGNTYYVFKKNGDAESVAIKLLGKTSVHQVRKFGSLSKTCQKNMYVGLTYTNSGETFDVMFNGTDGFAYFDSGVFYPLTLGAGFSFSVTDGVAYFGSEAGGVVTPAFTAGTPVSSLSQLSPVQVRAIKANTRSDAVYTDNGTNFSDMNALGNYYKCTKNTRTDAQGNTYTYYAHVSGTAGSTLTNPVNVTCKLSGDATTEYQLFKFTNTDATVDTVILDPADSKYYKVTYAGATETSVPGRTMDGTNILMNDTVAVWEGMIKSATPLDISDTDYSLVYKNDVKTWAENVDYDCTVPEDRWEQFTDTFTLKGQDYTYLVLRNAYGDNTANDFAIDDIAFIPYNEFNLNVQTGANSSATACANGIVTLTGAINVDADRKDALEAYIHDFGFFFEGKSIKTNEWVRLGNGVPLQVQSSASVLELQIPLSEYNLYSEFRLSVSATTSGFAGKCITFATPNEPAQEFENAPQFVISGDDICVEDGDNSEKTGVFTITNTNSKGKGWKVRVRLPDGTYKWLTPAEKTCTP